MTDDHSNPVNLGDDDSPQSSKEWLERIADAERVLAPWQTAADNVDKLFGELENLRGDGDRKFSLFWSNIQVLGPSIYARPPVPVVTPKFKDRRPLYRTASEFLERACVVSFDMSDIDATMISLRDDLSVVGRGAGWLRFESDDDGDRVCIEHLERRDFLHDPANKWSDVDWVARRAWLSRKEMKKRFGRASSKANYEVRSDEHGSVSREGKCGVWEIWCKSEDAVVWVTDGQEKVLDRKKPHLKLSSFWPCPKPVYASTERRSLVPLPDVLQYKAQLEEISMLTSRISALTDAVRLRGFYSGGGDVGDAVERAMKMHDEEAVLIPVPNLAALSAGASGSMIEWLPLDLIANTITGLIELRRQVIDDVYQIIGLSDIMRGATEAQETLGAQQLKQQNGSVRVRDKQNEMIRWARDAVRISAEIMATEFDMSVLEDMAQMDLPTNADVKKQIAEIEKAAKEAAETAGAALQEAVARGEEIDPAQVEAQVAEQQAAMQARIASIGMQVTSDQVKEFIRDNKLRPFILDIETDSTVYPDEMAEKSARAEFMSAFSGSMQSLMPMMQMGPEAVAIAGGVFKFALSPYRVGRELEGLIDDFVDRAPEMVKAMQAQASEAQDEGLAAAQMKLADAELAKVQSQTIANKASAQLKFLELEAREAEAQAKAAAEQQRIELEAEKTRGTIAETAARIDLVEAQIAKIGMDGTNQARKEDREDVKTAADIEMRASDQAMAAQDRMRRAFEGDRAAASNPREERP